MKLHFYDCQQRKYLISDFLKSHLIKQNTLKQLLIGNLKKLQNEITFL